MWGIVIPLLIMGMSSCNVTSALQENESLLVKNKIVINGEISNKRALKESLETIPIQSPNRKMFGVLPVRLAIYSSASQKKYNKFRNWLMKSVGEEPVVFKPVIANKSALDIRTYMFNRGYLHSEVQETHTINKKKTVVTYTITPNEQFFIDSIFLPKNHPEFVALLDKKKKDQLLFEGDPLDIDVLDEERKRIADIFRNKGYYYFSKDYIVFEIDSNYTEKTANLHLKINEPINGNGHQKYDINNVYTYTNYQLGAENQILNDTINEEEYYFIADKHQYRTRMLRSGIFFEKGEKFKLDNFFDTKRKISNFGTFRFVDINFADISDSTGQNLLDVHIHLTPAKKQSMSIQVEGNQNTLGLTGSAVSFTYRNKNLFQGADLLQFRISSGLEFQFNGNGQALNNTDVTTELSYSLNRFLLPFPMKKVSKKSNVKTTFTLGYQYQRRIKNYSLHSTNFSFGYEWNESNNKKHIYNPISLNFLLIPKKTDEFQSLLDQIPSLRRSFEEQLIAGSNYTFLYSNKNKETDRSYMYFNGNIRLAGNVIQAFAATINKNKEKEKPYGIGKREYSQFARFEGNIVHHWDFSRHAQLVTRFNTGIIVPYGNSEFAPYFQQFYAGGANSVRAFRLRAIGPGTYADTTATNNDNLFFDQAGDIKIETNTELRFDIYKFFKGAIFVDAGNVWLLKNDTARVGGQFEFNQFHKGIALGTGFGARLDFSYFVIRLDMAFPIRDPRLPAGETWAIKDFKFFDKQWRKENLIFNLAIGYPF
ncbi:MAG: BamA/TamA family outer membrane protein [Chitinophagales bacterium]